MQYLVGELLFLCILIATLLAGRFARGEYLGATMGALSEDS